jgi:ribosomal protein S27AE
MQLTDFECPNCGASEMVASEERRLICVFCGSSFGEVARICPGCGHYNQVGVRHCSRCGTRLLRACSACGADNWVLAEHCVVCGRNLDMIERMTHRWKQSTQQWLYEQREGMAALKEAEEQASQQRMAALMEAERIRQEAIALARESQQQRDRQLFTVMGVVIAIFAIVVVLALLLTSGGS